MQNLIATTRRRLGIPQYVLARRLGVVKSTVYRWENDHTNPSLDVLKEIATILTELSGVPIEVTDLLPDLHPPAAPSLRAARVWGTPSAQRRHGRPPPRSGPHPRHGGQRCYSPEAR